MRNLKLASKNGLPSVKLSEVLKNRPGDLWGFLPNMTNRPIKHYFDNSDGRLMNGTYLWVARNYETEDGSDLIWENLDADFVTLDCWEDLWADLDKPHPYQRIKLIKLKPKYHLSAVVMGNALLSLSDEHGNEPIFALRPSEELAIAEFGTI